MIEILNAQLGEPFRIVLLIGLYITMLRTQAQSGTYLPLAVGAVAVSVILATTMNASGAPLGPTVGMGIAANIILLAIIHGGWMLYARISRK